MLGGLLAAALGPGPEPVPPTPRDYALSWEAPSECPDEASIRRRIEAWRLDPHGEGEMQVTGRVLPTASGYRLTLTTSFAGQTNARVVDFGSCSEAGDAAALVVAVALTPSLARAEDRSIPEPPTAVEETVVAEGDPIDPIPAAAEHRPLREAAPRRRLARPSVIARADAGPEWGALPALGGTVGVTLGLDWRKVGVHVTGRWIGVRIAEGPAASRAGVQMGAVAPALCGLPRAGAWTLPVCGAIEAGVVRVDRLGFRRPDPVFGPWLAPLITAGAVRSFGRFGISLEVGAAVPLVDTRAFSAGSLLFAPKPVSLRSVVGFQIALP